MEAYKSAMIRLLWHPAAAMVGIIVTFLVALVTLIPAAEEYSVLRERSEDVALSLEQGGRDQDWFPKLRSKYAEIQQELETHQRRTIDEDAAHALRESIVQLARDAHCHLRKVDLGNVRVRQWHKFDHPITTVSTAQRGKKTDYELEVRELRLTLSGSLDEIQQFMQSFESLDVQMSIQQLNLRTLDVRGEQLQLELALQLFGIRRATKEISPVL